MDHPDATEAEIVRELVRRRYGDKPGGGICRKRLTGMTDGPLDLVDRFVAILDDLAIPYAVGGSVATALVGEPRSTVDVDIAVDPSPTAAEALIERVAADFYVPKKAATAAVAAHSSFNTVDTVNGLKVDLFVLGDGLLDRRQIERRVFLSVPESNGRSR